MTVRCLDALFDFAVILTLLVSSPRLPGTEAGPAAERRHADASARIWTLAVVCQGPTQSPSTIAQRGH